jgi:hypothetical protein
LPEVSESGDLAYVTPMAEQISSSTAFAAPSEANVRENAGINAVISMDAQSSHAMYRRRCCGMNI